jgi:integrative and conjugative element protein (TIGR02256 family)
MTKRSDEAIVFERRRGGRLKISHRAVSQMVVYRQELPSRKEAGGVLLGRRIQGGGDVVVDLVTTPMPGDRRTRTTFHRARSRHQAEIDRVWRESHGTSVYLGEWHTHPEKWPQPSWVDRADWCRKVIFDRFSGPIFFLILGTTAVTAWEGRRMVYPNSMGTVTIQ